MALNSLLSANDILNRVAAEVGIAPVIDPYASLDPSFVKMKYLLNTAGEELCYIHQWEFLTRSHNILTTVTDSGTYDLPPDFGYMINQTGWERNNNVPLGGPLTAQEWTYLIGRDLASHTLYASFRISEGSFNILPSPPPVNLDINFEYISKDWVRSGTEPFTYSDSVTVGTQKPLYDRTLISRYLKVKYLEAGGFDTTKAQDDFTQCFSFLAGKDKGAAVINAGRSSRGIPYLSGYNVPDTGFGR